MSVMDRVQRRILVDGSNATIVGRARLRRWNLLRATFPGIEHMHVIDLGGRASDWLSSPVQPGAVTVLNLVEQEAVPDRRIATVRGDACDVPPEIREGRFDLVFSNSLIEHVGGHARRVQVAETVGQLSDRHWVQTPYRYFPIEPHWMLPGLQFFPHRAQATLARHWPLPPWRPSDQAAALEEVLNIELLTRTQMQYYFPDSELRFERFVGLPKSLIAVKRG